MSLLNEFKKILIAVDASDYSQKAVQYGMDLARQLKSEVALIHVDEFPIMANVGGDPIMGDQMIIMPELVEIQKDSANHLLEQMVSEYGKGLTVTKILKSGDIKSEILETAKSWEASIIIVGTHGRTGLDHFLLGSMAESITRHSECPVLIVPNKVAES
jgi:nucleotide-binding universal stress UspA family protein